MQILKLQRLNCKLSFLSRPAARAPRRVCSQATFQGDKWSQFSFNLFCQNPPFPPPPPPPPLELYLKFSIDANVTMFAIFVKIVTIKKAPLNIFEFSPNLYPCSFHYPCLLFKLPSYLKNFSTHVHLLNFIYGNDLHDVCYNCLNFIENAV